MGHDRDVHRDDERAVLRDGELPFVVRGRVPAELDGPATLGYKRVAAGLPPRAALRHTTMSDLVKVTLPDGSQKDAPKGQTVVDFVKTSIGAGLAKAAYFAKLDGEPVDLSRKLDRDAKLEVVTTKSPEALEVARHDAAHVMASVVQKLYPGTQVTIGPAIEDGFYYDFARDTPFTPEDLEKIEKATNEAIAQDLPFVRDEISMDAALGLFERMGEKYKVEIVKDIAAPGREDPHALSPRRLGGLLPRAARPVDEAHRRREAPQRRRRVLAAATRRTRCSSASTAPPSSTRRSSRRTSRSSRR